MEVKTMTQRQKLKAIMAHPYYQTLRKSFGAKDSLATIRLLIAFNTGQKTTQPENRKECK
jgi:hypothetical protein